MKVVLHIIYTYCLPILGAVFVLTAIFPEYFYPGIHVNRSAMLVATLIMFSCTIVISITIRTIMNNQQDEAEHPEHSRLFIKYRNDENNIRSDCRCDDDIMW